MWIDWLQWLPERHSNKLWWVLKPIHLLARSIELCYCRLMPSYGLQYASLYDAWRDSEEWRSSRHHQSSGYSSRQLGNTHNPRQMWWCDGDAHAKAFLSNTEVADEEMARSLTHRGWIQSPTSRCRWDSQQLPPLQRSQGNGYKPWWDV